MARDLTAQNLVPNPGFEDLNYCPDSVGKIASLKYWYNASAKTWWRDPSHFHRCAGDRQSRPLQPSVPWNGDGYQFPYEGEGYAGIYICSHHRGWTFELRDYLGIKLKQPLKPGRLYRIAFQVNQTQLSKWHFSTNNQGVLFNYGELIEEYINRVHAVNKSIIRDTLNWTEIELHYIAEEPFTHMVIGNFFEFSGTAAEPLADSLIHQHAFYNLDAVSVEERPFFRIYPNPATEFVKIADESGQLNKEWVYIYDSMGRLTKTESVNFSNGVAEISLDNYSAGLYFLKVFVRDISHIFKLVVY